MKSPGTTPESTSMPPTIRNIPSLEGLYQFHEGVYYKFIDEKVSFNEARLHCEQDQSVGIVGQLPMLTSEKMMGQFEEKLKKDFPLTSEQPLWLGQQYLSNCKGSSCGYHLIWINETFYSTISSDFFKENSENLCGRITPGSKESFSLVNCSMALKFICQFDSRPEAMETKTTAEIRAEGQSCNAKGLKGLFKADNGDYYKEMVEKTDFRTAQDLCVQDRTLGVPGRLSVLVEKKFPVQMRKMFPLECKGRRIRKCPRRQQKANSKLRSGLWIGLHAEVKTFAPGYHSISFLWTSGDKFASDLSIFRAHPGLFADGQSKCVFLSGNVFSWVDCEEKNFFVCQFSCPIQSPPPSSSTTTMTMAAETTTTWTMSSMRTTKMATDTKSGICDPAKLKNLIQLTPWLFYKSMKVSTTFWHSKQACAMDKSVGVPGSLPIIKSKDLLEKLRLMIIKKNMSKFNRNIWIGLYVKKYDASIKNKSTLLSWVNGDKFEEGQATVEVKRLNTIFKCGTFILRQSRKSKSKQVSTNKYITLNRCSDQLNFICQFDCSEAEVEKAKPAKSNRMAKLEAATTTPSLSRTNISKHCNREALSNLHDFGNGIYFKRMNGSANFTSAHDQCANDSSLGVRGYLPILDANNLLAKFRKMVTTKFAIKTLWTWLGLTRSPYIHPRKVHPQAKTNKKIYAHSLYWDNLVRFQHKPRVANQRKYNAHCGAIQIRDNSVPYLNRCDAKANFFCQFYCK